MMASHFSTTLIGLGIILSALIGLFGLGYLFARFIYGYQRPSLEDIGAGAFDVFGVLFLLGFTLLVAWVVGRFGLEIWK